MVVPKDAALPRARGRCSIIAKLLRLWSLVILAAAMGILLYRIHFFQVNAPSVGNGSVDPTYQSASDKIKFFWCGFVSNLVSVVGMTVTALAYYGVVRFRGSRVIGWLSTSRAYLGAVLMVLGCGALACWLAVFIATIGNSQFVKSGIDVATAIVVGSQLCFALGCFQTIADIFPWKTDVMKGGEDAHVRGSAAHQEMLKTYKYKGLLGNDVVAQRPVLESEGGRYYVHNWVIEGNAAVAPAYAPTYAGSVYDKEQEIIV